MPPKKAAAKAKEAEKAKAAAAAAAPPPPPPPPPSTVSERSRQRYEAANPLDEAIRKVGISGLTPEQRQTWANIKYVRDTLADSSSGSSSSGGHGSGSRKGGQLGNKAQREIWRSFNESGLPLRALRRPTRWGSAVGELSPDQFRARADRRLRLTALQVEHRAFLDKRERAAAAAASTTADAADPPPTALLEAEIDEEKRRRKEMARLRQELYGEMTGSLASDPAWDDVVPIPLVEPEGALASINYSDDYAEAISYLRAVMANKEYSPRCLKLTEHVIDMNPAHYTVWLYRFSIVQALAIPIPDEIEWLNTVALEHLKNYQIWHHRNLLIEAYHPTIAADRDEVARLAASERAFIAAMLREDTKNYHVWSYRQFLVRRLGIWRDPEEMAAVERLIKDDVRNNSAWAHRFFLVFSDPESATEGSHSTEPDPAVPADVIDREVAYARAGIELAPQNQSPWNYLRGVLVKGSRLLSTVEDLVRTFVADLGDEEKEEVKSTHALDLLAEICAEKGDKDAAALCLDRLGDKWDRIRKGYWDWRKRTLPEEGDKGSIPIR
ncbi:hypothetical protein GGTG_06248 [Gaeumannomyces tritici R3-111a-1]|uniref:Protein farnesyltransferase/geranylgeranyltransferase type-1 subunit alpha n=1 Tax=Gaeumannomyces tritici (strain R3-111a-1) TaxID=644352 RepID=J3NY95_GAET3|nr:hypothetical protein GGTG_06248 [Gaeumannomyces tritici R3-111a-1]EJT76328.1 hypothetical protein GGTG_06248 [Gaeumannomyces tritici R3-111a-1]